MILPPAVTASGKHVQTTTASFNRGFRNPRPQRWGSLHALSGSSCATYSWSTDLSGRWVNLDKRAHKQSAAGGVTEITTAPVHGPCVCEPTLHDSSLWEDAVPMNHRSRLAVLALLLSVSTISCLSLVNRLTFMPDRKTVLPASALPPDTELVAIRTEDNVMIQALKFNNPSSDKALLFFQGNAGNIYTWRGYGTRLRSMGFTVLLVSYRGYGGSEGTPTEAGVYLDAEAAFAYVNQTLKYASKDIVVIGKSLGTAVAVNVAQHKDLRGLILVAPVSSWNDLADSFLDGLSVLIGKKMFDSIGKINNISCPILIIHGDNDELAPYEQGRALFDRYRGRRAFVTIKGGMHNTLEHTHPAEFWGAVRDFLHGRSSGPRH